MNKNLSIIILSCCLFAICCCSFKKVIHNTDPEAKCLDGTPGLIFVDEGSVTDKFIIYFIGGGYCGQQTLAATLESCYQRSKTDMGSSIYWPDNLDGQAGGILTDSELYPNWTKVLVGYCDGAFHQGYTKQPIKYKDATLYFRGSLVTKSHFKYLINTYKMDQASKIILSGGSAGGVAAFVWSQYLRSIVKNPNAVYTIPDAGFFPMANTFKDNIPLASLTLQNIVKVANQDQSVPISQCSKYFGDDDYKCLIPQFYHSFLKGNFLWLNSEYDSWGISNILQIKCLKQGKSGAGTLQNCTSEQKNYIEYYRNKTLSLVSQMKNQGHSFWMIACSLHASAPWNYTYNVPILRVPQQSENSVRNAIKQFVLEDKPVWMVDSVAWPNNKPCAY